MEHAAYTADMTAPEHGNVLVQDDKDKAVAWKWTQRAYVHAMAVQLTQDRKHWIPVEVDPHKMAEEQLAKHMAVVPAWRRWNKSLSTNDRVLVALPLFNSINYFLIN